MKNLILILAILLSSLSVYAQSQNEQAEMNTLVMRVDSLEHQLSYLKLTYELNTLNSDITMFSNEVYTKSIAIQLNLYSRYFDSDLADSYKRYFESCKNKMNSISELIDAKKSFFTLNVATYPYSESELKTLFASYNIIDNAFEVLQNSMKVLDISIKEYRKYL